MFRAARTAALVAASLALAGCWGLEKISAGSSSRDDAFSRTIELAKSRPCKAEPHSLDCVQSAKPKADAANALLPYIPPANEFSHDAAEVIRGLVFFRIADDMTEFYRDNCQEALSGGSAIPQDCYDVAYTVEGALATIARSLPEVPRYGPSQAPAQSWTMPNEIGKDYGTAATDVYAFTHPTPGERPVDEGGTSLNDRTAFLIIYSEDLTGQGRSTGFGSGWQVCSSTPPPGETFTPQTNIVFGVVKIGTEKCP